MNGLCWGNPLLYQVDIETNKGDIDDLCYKYHVNEYDLYFKYNHILTNYNYRPTLFLTHIQGCATRSVYDDLKYYKTQFSLLQDRIYNRDAKLLNLLR